MRVLKFNKSARIFSNDLLKYALIFLKFISRIQKLFGIWQKYYKPPVANEFVKKAWIENIPMKSLLLYLTFNGL